MIELLSSLTTTKQPFFIRNDQIGILLLMFDTPASMNNTEEHNNILQNTCGLEQELSNSFVSQGRVFGKPPVLNRYLLDQAAAVQAVLNEMEPGRFFVQLGMEHTHPFIEESIEILLNKGLHRIIGLILAPQFSQIRFNEFVNRIERIITSDEKVDFTLLKSWYRESGYLAYLSRAIHEQFDYLAMKYNLLRRDIEVIFTAHGHLYKGDEIDLHYMNQVNETASEVARLAALDNWSVSLWIPHTEAEQKLNHGLLEMLPVLKKEGRKGIVLCPVDCTVESLGDSFSHNTTARILAAEPGMVFARTKAPNSNSGFCAAIARQLIHQADYQYV